jgi:CheY-like chemotaxis protein
MAAAARTLRVLVVDDDADTVDTSALLLQLDGHEVQTASDGVRTLERAAAFRPHLILLDVGMPGMDGYEVGRRIQGLSLPARPYLAAVTGYGWQDDKRRSAGAGFDLHLTKPVELETLRSLLSLLKGSIQISDESAPVLDQRRRLAVQSDVAPAGLFLQQLEMASLCLDAATVETTSFEVHRRTLSHAARAYDMLRTWLSAHAGSDAGLSEVAVKIDALQERLVRMQS